MSPQDRKHGREAARRRAAQHAAREASRRRRQRMQAIVAGVAVAAVVLALLATTFARSGDDDDVTTDTTPTTATTEPADDGAEVTAIADVADETVGAPFEFGTGECAPDAKPASRPEAFAAAPMRCLKDDVTYKAVIGTSEGSFSIDLLPTRAPGTVNNFIQLAKWGWYDGDDFHRVVPGFVIQGGDPVGQGEGSPGYAITDELPPEVSSYTPGAVAMANSGADTNGSQWFVCIDCTSQLQQPAYSLFGFVSDGYDVVQTINTREGGEVEIIAVEIVEVPKEG